MFLEFICLFCLVLAMEKLRKKSDITKKYLERLDGRNHINHPISFGFSHWSNVPGFHAPWMDGFRHFKKKTTGSNWNTLWYKRLHSYGKSPCLMGKSTINGSFSIVISNYQRVICWFSSHFPPWSLFTNCSPKVSPIVHRRFPCCLQPMLFNWTWRSSALWSSWGGDHWVRYQPILRIILGWIIEVVDIMIITRNG